MLRQQNDSGITTQSHIAKQKVKPSTAYVPIVVKTVRLSQSSTEVVPIGRRTRSQTKPTAHTQSSVKQLLNNQLTKRRRPSNVRGAFAYGRRYFTLNKLPRISGRRRLAIERAVIRPPTKPAGGLISKAVSA